MDPCGKFVHIINMVCIDRVFNAEADGLAKDGMLRSKLIYGWS